MDRQDILNLKKRYIVWLYKTTKEALDRIERKFTQLEVDRFILGELKKEDRAKKIKKLIDQFEAYIQKKEEDGLSLKYAGKELDSGYLFLSLKLKAIEKAIGVMLGKSALRKIKDSYEEEMIRRILAERSDKV
jgi:hypothetical protein